MSTKKIAGKDPRYNSPLSNDGRMKSLGTTAKETYATGKNTLAEHGHSNSGKGKPGKSTGHGN